MTNAPLPVQAAAEWLAAQASPPHPLIPALKTKFELTAKEACEAVGAQHLRTSCGTGGAT